MANQEFDPTTDQTHVVDVPHSGDSRLPEEMRETPVNDFDNTTLHEAHEQGFLTTPETPAALVEKQKKKMSRGKKIGMWLTGGVLVGSAVPVSLALALNGGDSAPEQQPGVSGPENPGTNAELEGIGIKLSEDQINDFKSGDPEKMSAVLDKEFIPKLEKALNDPSKISSLAVDPEALRQLQGMSEDALSRVAGQADAYIGICPTVITSEYEGGPCDGRPSILNEHEDVVLPANITSADNIGGIPVDYTLPGVTVGVNGDRIYFK